MRVYVVRQPEIKTLMHALFYSGAFDMYEVRSVSVSHFVTMEIDGRTQGGDRERAGYISWAELKRYIIHFIKGKEKPKQIKIVFSMPRALLDAISAGSAAAFLNMEYEGEEIRFTTATSQKSFSLDKDQDMLWDEYAKDFLKLNGISASEES